MPYKFGYVPPPRPDETVYSFLAAQQRLLPDRNLIRRLFGGWKVHVRPDWPIGLNALSAALPSGLQLDPQRLLHEHTLVPLFLPLLEESRQDKLFRATLEADAGPPWIFAGAHQQTVRELRVCPACFKKDRQQGRAYWHRIHQYHGVLTCPHHTGVMLQPTGISRNDINREKRFYDLDQIQLAGPSPSPLSPSEHNRAVQISTGIAMLLANPCFDTNIIKIRMALRERAFIAGYMASPGKLKTLKIVSDFSNWMGTPLAAKLRIGDESGYGGSNWIYRFLTGDRASISPLKYTALALFLGAEPHELAHASSGLIIPPLITRIRTFGGIPASHLRFQRVTPKLIILWNTPTLSVGEIADRLKISPLTVRRWAVRLNLGFPRKGPYPVKKPVPRPTLDPFDERLSLKRSQWLASTKGLNGGMVRNPAINKLYLWLSRYDATWLKRNWPKYRRREKIDWQNRDVLMVEKLTQAAERLSKKNPPCWLSKTRLIQESGYNGFWHRSHRIRLPKAAKLLAKIQETRASFAIRCLYERRGLQKINKGGFYDSY